MNTRPRFLVVDDEPALLRAGARVLEKNGFDCRLASSAVEALGILETEEIDVMLTDIVMPGMDGLWLARVARRRFPRTTVVMTSGRYDQTALDDALRAGAADYIAKPYHPTELVAAATRAVERRPARVVPASHSPHGDFAAVADLDTLLTYLH